MGALNTSSIRYFHLIRTLLRLSHGSLATQGKTEAVVSAGQVDAARCVLGECMRLCHRQPCSGIFSREQTTGFAEVVFCTHWADSRSRVLLGGTKLTRPGTNVGMRRHAHVGAARDGSGMSCDWNAA